MLHVSGPEDSCLVSCSQAFYHLSLSLFLEPVPILGQKCCLSFFFLALIPEQLVAVSFSEKSKMCLCTGRKKIFCTSPAEEMAQKIQSGSVQLWEPLENDGTMSALGDALHVPGGVGDTGV